MIEWGPIHPPPSAEIVGAPAEGARSPAGQKRDPSGTPRALIAVIAFVVVVAALWAAKVLLIPLALAGLASCGLEPFNKRLVRLGLPRPVAAGVVVTAVVALLVGSGWTLQAPATKFINRLPAITQKLRSELDRGGALSSTVQPVQQAANELQKAADGTGPPPARGVTRVQVEQAPMRLSDVLLMGTVSVVEFGIQAAMVVFLVFYLLASGDRYRAKLVDIAGPSMFRKHITLEILNRMIEQVERFLIARLIISVIVGVATWAVLALIGMPQPVIWGILAGVLNNVPYLGPTAAVAAIALAALVQLGTLEMAAAAGGLSTLIAMLEGFALTPWMMGRAGRMNTGVVFVSLMFWGWIWGIWGMLLAVPLMMAIKAVCDHVDALRPVSELLGE